MDVLNVDCGWMTFTARLGIWYRGRMPSSEPNPYAVEAIVDDSSRQRDWYAQFPLLLWIGTIVYGAYTVVLLNSDAADDKTAGYLYMFNAMWLLWSATQATLSHWRASVAAAGGGLAQLGIAWAIFFIPIDTSRLVSSSSLGGPLLGMGLLFAFYLWRETVGMSEQPPNSETHIG